MKDNYIMFDAVARVDDQLIDRCANRMLQKATADDNAEREVKKENKFTHRNKIRYYLPIASPVALTRKGKLGAIAACAAGFLTLVLAIGLLIEYSNKTAISEADDFLISNGVLVKYLGSSSELKIPEDVRIIASTAFDDNPSLKNIRSLTTRSVTIEDGALAGLDSLECIIVEGSAEFILLGNEERILTSSVQSLVSQGVSLQRTRETMTEESVLTISDENGIDLVFDNSGSENPLVGSKTPKKIRVTKDNMLMLNGIYVGMTSMDAKKLDMEWTEIFRDVNSKTYCTSTMIGNLKVTLTWSMSDEQYDSWVNTLNDYDSFESQPEKFYKPYDDNNVGMVEEVTIERVFAIDRSIVNFDFGNESNEVLSSFSVRIPDTWWDSSDSDDGTIYLRKDERFEIDVPAMELMTSIKVDKTYTMDFAVHALTRAGGTWNPLEGYTIKDGITENGYKYILYETEDNVDYFAYCYIRLSDNCIVCIHFWEMKKNQGLVYSVINSIINLAAAK